MSHSNEFGFIPNNAMFNVDHYRKLIDCAKAGRRSEWNDWRRENPDQQILLEEAQFRDVNLEYFDLSNVHLRKAVFLAANLDNTILSRANLEEAVFQCSTLRSAVLTRANLTQSKLGGVNMAGSKLLMAKLAHANLSESVLSRAELIKVDLSSSVLTRTNLDGACLREALLKRCQAYDASFIGAELERANLEYASLSRSRLADANLKRASLIKAALNDTDLRGATLDGADLRSAHLDSARVNEATSFWGCFVDRRTSFSRIPLGSVQIDIGTRQLVEYNLRRRAWEGWCREHKCVGWLARLFWMLSDYGLSTGRIIALFLAASVVFGLAYWTFAIFSPPGVVSGLGVSATGDPIPKDMLLLRCIYFSVVTMTTGFGDMYAVRTSVIGHCLLLLQVILGYVVLAALVTRFGVLFTGGGPSADHFKDFEEGRSKSAYWPEDRLHEFAREREK